MEPHKVSDRSCEFQTSHSRWQALTNRTPASHSAFFYGVKSTRIYCRPTCSARLARRANVVFYDSEDQARLDGFNPCKRCKPDDKTYMGDNEELVMRVLSLMRNRQNAMNMRGGLKDLANEVGVSPSHLCRVFKKTMGITIGTYIKEFEVEEETCNLTQSQSPATITSSVSDFESNIQTPLQINWESHLHIDQGDLILPTHNMVDATPVSDFDLDLNFDLDQWYWIEAFSNDDIQK